MQERLLGTYDAMIISHDTRANLEKNKESLLPFELAISTDTNDLFFKDEQGNLGRFFGTSGDLGTDLLDRVDKNTLAIAENKNLINDKIGESDIATFDEILLAFGYDNNLGIPGDFDIALKEDIDNLFD